MDKNVKNSVDVYVKHHSQEQNVNFNKIIGVLTLKMQKNAVERELVMLKKDVNVKKDTMEKIVNTKELFA